MRQSTLIATRLPGFVMSKERGLPAAAVSEPARSPTGPETATPDQDALGNSSLTEGLDAEGAGDTATLDLAAGGDLDGDSVDVDLDLDEDEEVAEAEQEDEAQEDGADPSDTGGDDAGSGADAPDDADEGGGADAAGRSDWAGYTALALAKLGMLDVLDLPYEAYRATRLNAAALRRAGQAELAASLLRRLGPLEARIGAEAWAGYGARLVAELQG